MSGVTVLRPDRILSEAEIPPRWKLEVEHIQSTYCVRTGPRSEVGHVDVKKVCRAQDTADIVNVRFSDIPLGRGYWLQVRVWEDKTAAARKRVADKTSAPPPVILESTNLKELRMKHQRLAQAGGDISYISRGDPDHVAKLAQKNALSVPKGRAGDATVKRIVADLPTLVYYSRPADAWTIGRLVQSLTPTEVKEEIARGAARGDAEEEWYWLEHSDATGPALVAEPLEDIIAAATMSPPQVFFYEKGTAFEGEGLHGQWWMQEFDENSDPRGQICWAKCHKCRAWRIVEDGEFYAHLRQNPVEFHCSDIHEKGCGARASGAEGRYLPELKQVRRRKRAPVQLVCDGGDPAAAIGSPRKRRRA